MKIQAYVRGDFCMNIAILDDEEVYRTQIQSLVEKGFPNETVLTFPTVMALLSSHNDVDLLLLDIEMPQMDGLAFAKTYANRFSNIVFISTHDELVFDAFGKNIIGFVKKNEVEEKLTGIIKEFHHKKTPTLELETMFDIVPIPIHLILYFHYDSYVVYVVTKKQSIELKYRSLKQVQSRLDNNIFSPIDRNTIINVTQISHFIKANKEVVMLNHEVLSVSKRNWKPLIQMYHKEILK